MNAEKKKNHQNKTKQTKKQVLGDLGIIPFAFGGN